MDYVGNKAINGTILAGVGGLAVGGAVGYFAGKRKNRSQSKRRKKSKSKSGSVRARSRGSRQRRTPHTAGKRKDTSHRRIRYTKNGQPYIIKGDGKAKFISRKSAKRSHKQKGGRY